MPVRCRPPIIRTISAGGAALLYTSLIGKVLRSTPIASDQTGDLSDCAKHLFVEAIARLAPSGQATFHKLGFNGKPTINGSLSQEDSGTGHNHLQ